MTICPKCNQSSSSDKVCTNCWADLTAKPRSLKPSRDTMMTKTQNVLLMGALLIACLFFVSMALQWMKEDRTEGAPPSPPVQTPNP